MFKKLTLIVALVAATACGGSQAEDTSNTTVVDEVSEETTTAVTEALPEGAAEMNAAGALADNPVTEAAEATAEAATAEVAAIRCTVLSSTASAGGSLTLNGTALTSDLTVKVGGTGATIVTATGPRMDLQLPAAITSGTVTVQRGTEDPVECGELTIE